MICQNGNGGPHEDRWNQGPHACPADLADQSHVGRKRNRSQLPTEPASQGVVHPRNDTSKSIASQFSGDLLEAKRVANTSTPTGQHFPVHRRHLRKPSCLMPHYAVTNISAAHASRPHRGARPEMATPEATQTPLSTCTSRFDREVVITNSLVDAAATPQDNLAVFCCVSA